MSFADRADIVGDGSGVSRLVFFDVDGTLVKSAPGSNKVHQQAFTHAFEKVYGFAGVSIDELPHQGMTDMWIIEELMLKRGVPAAVIASKMDAAKAAMVDYCRAHAKDVGVEVLPGVAHLLSQLAARPDTLLGLVTGNLEEIGLMKIHASGLGGLFSVGGFGSDHTARSELIKLAVERAKEKYPGIARRYAAAATAATPPKPVFSPTSHLSPSAAAAEIAATGGSVAGAVKPAGAASAVSPSAAATAAGGAAATGGAASRSIESPPAAAAGAARTLAAIPAGVSAPTSPSAGSIAPRATSSFPLVYHVGDTLHDLKAAHDAGVRGVGVATGGASYDALVGSYPKYHPMAVVRDMTDTARMLQIFRVPVDGGAAMSSLSAGAAALSLGSLAAHSSGAAAVAHSA